MKKYYLKNYFGDGYLSQWLKSMRVISIASNDTMKGISRISRKPRWKGWNGLRFQYLTVYLSEEALNILKPYTQEILDDVIYLSDLFPA